MLFGSLLQHGPLVLRFEIGVPAPKGGPNLENRPHGTSSRKERQKERRKEWFAVRTDAWASVPVERAGTTKGSCRPRLRRKDFVSKDVAGA